jgi:hypothetical protein
MTAAAPQSPVAAKPQQQPRYALGMPAGSVRALLAFGVLGSLWLVVLGHSRDQKVPMVFIYLQFLMVLILGHFFTAHGYTIGKKVSSRSPLWLPGGSVRILLILGYSGLAYYLYHRGRELQYATPDQGDVALMLGLMLGGFFIGHFVNDVVEFLSGGQPPYWYQDIQAWFALISLIGLMILVFKHMFINPGLPPDEQLQLTKFEAGLAGVVGFYFGARS